MIIYSRIKNWSQFDSIYNLMFLTRHSSTQFTPKLLLKKIFLVLVFHLCKILFQWQIFQDIVWWTWTAQNFCFESNSRNAVEVNSFIWVKTIQQVVLIFSSIVTATRRRHADWPSIHSCIGAWQTEGFATNTKGAFSRPCRHLSTNGRQTSNYINNRITTYW